MAVELEQTVMNEIGLGNDYRWFNGSGSCGHIRQSAVNKLPQIAKRHGLSISPAWLRRCRTASQVDGGQYSLTNTWVTCSYAIQDAIYRKEDGKGFSPPNDNEGWQCSKDDTFWNDLHRWTKKDY